MAVRISDRHIPAISNDNLLSLGLVPEEPESAPVEAKLCRLCVSRPVHSFCKFHDQM